MKNDWKLSKDEQSCVNHDLAEHIAFRCELGDESRMIFGLKQIGLGGRHYRKDILVGLRKRRDN